MESGRMPLPTARHTLPDVDSPRDQGSGVDPRAHAQIDRLLWRGELGDGEILIQLVRNVRRQDIRDVSQVIAAPRRCCMEAAANAAPPSRNGLCCHD